MNVNKYLLLLSLIGIQVVVGSCKSRYEFTKNKQGATATNNEDIVPYVPSEDDSIDDDATTNNGAPDDGVNEDSSTTTTNPTPTPTPNPSPTATPNPVPTPSTTPNANNDSGPTADIEVLQNNVVVTKILVGIPVVIRPTATTKDSNNVEGCRNPGILKANWRAGAKAIGSIVRLSLSDCKSLSVSGTFTKTGTFTLYLEVVTDELKSLTVQKPYEVIEANSNTGGGKNSPTQM